MLSNKHIKNSEQSKKNDMKKILHKLVHFFKNGTQLKPGYKYVVLVSNV